MSGRKIKNMEEFAKVSGISRPTLSKFFHDPDTVRASTRAKIEQALEEYDYRPNIFAINQNRKLTKTIAIVVPYLADPFFAEIVRRIERRCIDAGYWPMVFSAHGERELENNALDIMRSLRPAGALIAPLGRKSDFDAVQRFTFLHRMHGFGCGIGRRGAGCNREPGECGKECGPFAECLASRDARLHEKRSPRSPSEA